MQHDVVNADIEEDDEDKHYSPVDDEESDIDASNVLNEVLKVRLTSEQIVKMKEPLRKLAKIAGIKYFHATFGNADSTRKQRVKALRSLIYAVFEAVDGEHAEELKEMVLKPIVQKAPWWIKVSGQKLQNIVENVGDIFKTSNSPTIRRLALSLVAPLIPLSILQEYILGLSPYYFKEAPKYAKQERIQMQMEERHIKFEREKIASFIEFIVSPGIVQDLPFGFATTRDSKGNKVELPNMIRIMVSERIFMQYERYMKEQNRTDLLLSRSSLLRILHFCTATKRKQLQGLDYYNFQMSHGFENLFDTIAKLGMSTEWVRKIVQQLKDAKHYLKADYKLHVKHQSRIATHCSAWSLSDPANTAFQKECIDHDHDQVCLRCENVIITLEEIEDAVDVTYALSGRLKIEAMYEIKLAKAAVLDFMKHVMRTRQQDLARSNAMDNLSKNQVYIITDLNLHHSAERKTQRIGSESEGFRGV